MDERKIIVFGGNKKSQLYYPLHPSKNKFLEHPADFETPIRGFAVSNVGDSIFLIGGNFESGYHPPSKSCIIFNLLTNDWSVGPEMGVARMAHSVGTYKDKIFAIGGRHEARCEVLDIERETWSPFASIPRPICQSSAVKLDDKIFLLGGHSASPATVFLTSILTYHPETDQWLTSDVTLPQDRHMHAATMTENSIVISGGSCSDVVTSSCVRFDPRSGKFTKLSSMSRPRSLHSLVTFDQQLIALGGDHHQKIGPLTVELYDQRRDVWASIDPLLFSNEGYYDYVKACVD